MERSKGKMGLREEYVPYSYDYFYGFIENATKGREAIFSVGNTKDEKNRANAEHLVECWNAFEEGGLVERLQSSHDELLKALEDGIILSGEELEALKSMATVDWMVKACAGALTPTDVAESVNGIIKSSEEKTKQAIAKAKEVGNE